MGTILAATARIDALAPFREPFACRGLSFKICKDAAELFAEAQAQLPDGVLCDDGGVDGGASFIRRWREQFPNEATPILIIGTAAGPPTCTLSDGAAGYVFPELGFEAGYAAIAVAVEAHWLKQRLVEVGKLALLGEIMAGVLHELKNPVNNMLGSLERVSQRIESDPAIARWAEIIRRNGELLRESVGSLLAGFRSHLPPQPVDVHETLDKAAHYALKGDATVRNIGLIRELGAENPIVHAPPGPLLHLFLNLLVNARQAIGTSSGTITIRSANADGRLTVEVHDSGPGIDPMMLKRMFQRFQTTKKTGSGIGLMLVKSVAEQIGGSVAAENSPNGGAVFRIELPVGG